jgi:hypothetical protein
MTRTLRSSWCYVVVLWALCYSFLSIKFYVCTWIDLLFVNMVSKLRFFYDKVEKKDLEREISNNIIGGCQVQKINKESKKWKDINISRVEEVISLNLDLHLLWNDLGVKLGEIVEDYKMFLFSQFQKKNNFFVKVMNFWKLCVRSGFLVMSPFFELFWICNFGIL